MVFLDNPTVSSDYIRQMMTTAEQQDIVTKTAMESIIKLLIIVELDRERSSAFIYPSLLKMELLQAIRRVEENQASLIRCLMLSERIF